MNALQAVAGEHISVRRWVGQQFDKLPRRFRPALSRQYVARYQAGDFYAANVGLREAVDTLGGFRFSVAEGEDALRDFAKARADECMRVALRWKDADAALMEMIAIAQRNGIKPPEGRNVTKQGQRARLLCVKWWRRALRRYVGRGVEGAAITLGMVHRRAGLYASHETVARRAQQKRRNREVMELIKAVGVDTRSGEVSEYTMAELSDIGTSNPEKRRLELMTRLAGFDQIAKAAGHAAEFYTLTAPSKYHARHHITGKENPKYNGAAPRETQAYLCNVWAKVRAALHRRGVRVYGFRVAEPHHDATPHWHMVLFMRAQDVATVRAVFKAYALAEDGNEPGADVHRFRAEAIDRSKGSAAGYLAKYIAKNIDGFGVENDWEAVAGHDDAASSAQRVDAWASCWGIRQFQQIGGAPVSVWRELRRLTEADAENAVFLEALILAADAGGDVDEKTGLSGWARYVNLMGGPMARRVDFPASCWREGGDVTGKLNAYGEEAAPAIKGILSFGAEVCTRFREWVFKRVGAAETPRSSVNNCTRSVVDFAYRAGEEFASMQKGAGAQRVAA